MVVAGDAGVERDDAEAVHVVDEVHGPIGGLQAEQLLAEGTALVVVAHRPDHLGTDAVGGGLDDGPDTGVGAGFALVGHVAGDDDRFRSGT